MNPDEVARNLSEAVDAMTLTTDISYDFVTDRLAVGNVASRQVPGFVAVVSMLATAPIDELYKAPAVPHEDWIPAAKQAQTPWIVDYRRQSSTPTLHVDINDGEGPGSPLGDGRNLADYLDDATSFIAAHIRRGCVLVHCGAGKSRSVSLATAYLCRYAGMSYTEALSLVKARRPGAAPADCFADAVKRWLRLDYLATTGPRR